MIANCFNPKLVPQVEPRGTSCKYNIIVPIKADVPTPLSLIHGLSLIGRLSRAHINSSFLTCCCYKEEGCIAMAIVYTS